MDFKNQKGRAVSTLDRPFTELFNLLKCHTVLPSGRVILAYTNQQLSLMERHAENSFDNLIEGLNALGEVVAFSTSQNYSINMNGIGNLISIVSNLVDALSLLKEDIGHVLHNDSD